MAQFYQDRIGYFKQYYDMNKDKIKERSRAQHAKKREERLRKMLEYNSRKKKYISYQDLMRGYKPSQIEPKIKHPVVKKYCGIIDFDF